MKTGVKYIPLIAVATLSMNACTLGQLDKLKNAGNPPAMEAVQNPVEKAGYEPVSWPAPKPETEVTRAANSLWQAGSKTFFRDQRARKEGDILTVVVSIQDKAELDNSTERTRGTTDSLDIPSVYGLQKNIRAMLPGETESDPLLGLSSSTDTNGEGTIDREEKIETKVAAVVTQVLPNGNLAINGTQEIRVNFEVRELSVQGIIRPEDISSSNTVDITQLAEARVSYGGRGQISDIQSPRIGQQIVDILSPF